MPVARASWPVAGATACARRGPHRAAGPRTTGSGSGASVRDPGIEAGKFNAGQKLSAAVHRAALPVSLLTRAMLEVARPFPDSWRNSATTVHDWSFGIWLVVSGHILKALSEPVRAPGNGLRSGAVAWAAAPAPL